MQVIHDAENAACVETIILHSSGEWLSCGKLSVPVSKGDAQGFGSALTYARRYSLSAAFGVAPEDDDGNAAWMKPNTGQQINADEYSKLDPDMQAAVDDLAGRVAQLLFRNDVAGAHAEIEAAQLDQEAKMALWSKLDSKQRSAIKKHAQSLKGE